MVALKILVLGGTGTIGSQLCDAVLRRGHDVYVVSRSKRDDSAGLRFISANVYDEHAFSDALGELSFDAVIDLLSFSKQQLKQNLRLMNGRCRQYIFVSSATVYTPSSSTSRISEETAFIDTGWSYPLNKIEAEHELVSTCAEFKMPYTIIRPYITYSEQRLSFGEWEGPLILDRIQRGLPVTLGRELAESRTTLTHAYDLAEGMAGLIGNPAGLNQDFHITSDDSHTWLEVLEVAAKALNTKLVLVDVPIASVKASFPELSGKIQDRCMAREFDNTKIKQAIPGFSCKYSLEMGYDEIISGSSGSLKGRPRILIQGRLDAIARQAKDTASKKAIGSYRHELFRESLRDYVVHSVGYYPPLYKLAKSARSLLTGQRKSSDPYGVLQTED